jgi:hypothetical protein
MIGQTLEAQPRVVRSVRKRQIVNCDTADESQSSRHIPCAVHKVVGTFQVPSTWNPGKCLTANGTSERACQFFCRLC